jgi:tetratricopeptide (TPR) repeat protein
MTAMTQHLTIPQAVALALQHHQSGRLAEAEGIYRQVLAAQPQHGDALYLLGTLASQTGHLPEAIELLRRAVAANPMAAQYQSNLGQMLAASGQLDEAEQTLGRAIELSPDMAEARVNLGVVLRRKGRNSQAIDEFRRALRLRPELAEVWNSLGDALQAAGQEEQAIDAFQEAAKLLPDYPDAFYNLGNAMSRKDQLDTAIAHYTKALSLRPDYMMAMNNLGIALKRQGKLAEALNTFERAVTMRPDFAEGWNNLSDILHDLGKLDAALAAAEKALALRPDYAEAHNNAANAMRGLGRLDEAIERYRKAIFARADFAAAENGLATALVDSGNVDAGIAAYQRAVSLQADFATAHYNLGMTLLVKGEFEQGWREHEWRSRLPERRFADFKKPMWDGSNLTGQRILLHAEQGFGDVIQFVRYVALVRQRGPSEVLLLCQPELTGLLRSLDESTTLIARGDPNPEFDVQCPLMSLPLVFETTLESIPASVPYLHAEPEIVEQWRRKMESGGGQGRFRIGLVWAGQPDYANDRNRSIPPHLLAPLAECPNIRWFSLQKGKAAQVPGLELTDWSSEFSDFAQTAGLIENLDLIITVDTAVAHLAGAMGKPVWTLVSFVPDWRWLLHRDDSPWYPTMKLFRQPRLGDWETPIRRIAEALAGDFPL